MKIKAIEVNNLFSYDEFKIEFNEGNIAVIVGPNNAGKSNLFRVLEFLKDVINDNDKIKVDKGANKKTIVEEVPNYLHDRSRRPRYAKIVVDIEFDDLEKEMLKNYFECFLKSNHPEFKKICDELGFSIEDKLVELFSKGEFIWEYKGEPSRRVAPYYKISMKMLKDEKLKEELKKLSIFDPIDLRSNNNGELYKFCKCIFDIKDASKEDIDNFAVVENLSYLEDLNKIIHKLSEILDESYIYFNNNEKNNTLQHNPLLYNSQNEPIFEVKDLGSWDTHAGGLYNFLKKYPLKGKDTIFLTLLLVGLSYLKNGNLSYDEILKYCENYPPDNILFEKAKNLFEYADKQFNDNQNLSFHHFILKLFDKAIIKFEEVRGYPEKCKITQINENEFENKNYEGNGKDLAKYLFYLKNAHELNIRNKYNEIRESFKEIFKSEKIDFDVVNHNGYPEIYIIFEKEVKKDNGESELIDYQLPIKRVGSGIFEVLNILAVVIGAEHKVILLDEPALHLHPVYQKKLLNVLKGEVDLKEDNKISEETKKLLENIKKRLEKNQVIIITHSPYFVDTKILENTFRFYKENGKTKAVNVGEIIKEKLIKEIEKKSGKFNGNLKIFKNISKLPIDSLERLLELLIKSNKLIDVIEDIEKDCPNEIKEMKSNILRKLSNIESLSSELYNEIDNDINNLINKIKTLLSGKYDIDKEILNNFEELESLKTPEEFIRNDGLIRSLFANGVILVEGDLEYISIPILLKKANCALEDYNIEIINVRSKKGFEKYVKLMNALRIPCAVICDGDAAYNLYNKNDKKWTLSDENLPCIIKVYDNIMPFWIKDIGTILDGIEDKIKRKKSALKKEINVNEPLEEELVKYGIEPIYNEIKEELKNKLLIFACKEYDWSGFLGSNNKDIENCMKKTYEFNDKEKLNELEQFIKNFINKCISL